jgi:hypothetical protein
MERPALVGDGGAAIIYVTMLLVDPTWDTG